MISKAQQIASPIGCLTTLNDAEYVETWIRCIEALARVKKLRDRRSRVKQNEITDMFLSTAACKAIQRVSTMAYPRNLEELTFKEISKVIKRNIRPKNRLVIAERTKFLETRQQPDESIVRLIHRLKESARFCEFERLGTGEMTTEDELIMLLLIEGMHNSALKHKLLEMLQSVNLTVETCIEFVQQLELIKKYNQQPNEEEAYSTNKYKILCKYCGEWHVREKNNCPTFSKTCFICKRKNHALKVSRYKKKLRNLKTRKWIEEKLKFSC